MLSEKQRRKLKIVKIISVCIAIFVALVTLALVITNFFVPVKYLSAYLVKAGKNELGQMRVTFVDVGYGDCTVVELPDGKCALIDAGNGEYSKNHKIMTALNARGIDKIDYLIATSVSDITCGGFEQVFKYKEVGEVFAPYCPATYINDNFYSFTRALKDSGKVPVYLEYGVNIAPSADYKFFVLSPTGVNIEGSEIDSMLEDPTLYTVNNASAVIWLEYGGVKFLLTGNVNEYVQYKLCSLAALGVEIGGEIIDISSCSVIKVPNHGAETAAYKGLYETFKPETAILSVGANALGCPSVNALTFAQTFAADRLYRTDYDGSVTVTVSGGGYTLKKEK